MWTKAILEKLDALRAADASLSVFGASTHGYRIRPRLPASEVEAFEQQFSIRLPEDYREYLLSVGNGGAGPDYGVFRLGFHADGYESVPWVPRHDVGTLAAAFPFSQPWNLPVGYWPETDESDPPSDATIEAAARELECAGIPLHRNQIGVGKRLNPFTKAVFQVTLAQLVDEAYFSPALMNGAVPLNTEGCNLSSWLVVTGTERGHVWRDLRADYRGIVPARADGLERLTFRDWYEGWVDRSLATVDARTR